MNSSKWAMAGLLVLFFSACSLFDGTNPMFDKIVDESPPVPPEIEVSLAWPGASGGWLAEGAGLPRDTDNEFTVVPGNPLKAAATWFYDGSFINGPNTPQVTAVYPAQQWERSADLGAFVVYYKIPGIASYDSATENLYLRVKWPTDSAFRDWNHVATSTTDSGTVYFISGGSLYFKFGINFVEGLNGASSTTWMKRGNAVQVEAVLFESPVVAGLAATVNTALAAAPRRKQRTFTIDLSGVYTGPLSAVFKSNDSPDGSAGVDLAPAQTLTFSTAGYASRKATLPAALQRAGYVFQGWNTKQNGSGAAFTAASDVTGAMTVYAKWAKKSGAAAANEAAAIGVSLSWPGSGAGWIAESSGSLVRDLDNEFITGVNPLKAAALAIATADLADAGDSGATLPYDGSGTAGHATSWQSKNSASEADFVIYYKIPGAASYASASENLYFRFSWDNGPWSPWQWAVNSATDTSSFQTSAGDLYFKTSQIFADGGPGSWVTKGDLLTLEIALFDGAVVAVPNRPVDLLTPSTRARRKERLFTVDLSEVTITP